MPLPWGSAARISPSKAWLAGGTDASNPLAMLLSGKAPKSFKEYGETGMLLTLPGNSEGLTLQVPDAGTK